MDLPSLSWVPREQGSLQESSLQPSPDLHPQLYLGGPIQSAAPLQLFSAKSKPVSRRVGEALCVGPWEGGLGSDCLFFRLAAHAPVSSPTFRSVWCLKFLAFRGSQVPVGSLLLASPGRLVVAAHSTLLSLPPLGHLLSTFVGSVLPLIVWGRTEINCIHSVCFI